MACEPRQDKHEGPSGWAALFMRGTGVGTMPPVVRRLFRFALNALTALSLLLCAAACALWFEAAVLRTPRLLTIGSPEAGVIAASAEYGLIVAAGDLRPIPLTRPLRHGQDFFDRTAPGLLYRSVRRPQRVRQLWVAYWLAAAVTALLPAGWVVRRAVTARRDRRRLGLCPRCGYDLRATPGRCPECGAVPEGAP